MLQCILLMWYQLHSACTFNMIMFVPCRAVQRLDLDGDGKLTQGDIHALFDSFTGYLAQGLPSASGFAGGFGLGFYYA